MRTAPTIAGSDPTGGAGLQADLQVFRAFGVHGAGVVTALTVQDTEGGPRNPPPAARAWRALPTARGTAASRAAAVATARRA